jgi:excisionase family DNA binding protein
MPRTKSRPTKKPSSDAGSNGTPEPVDVLTLEEAAAYLRVSAEDVLAMMGAEGLPGRKFGAEWRFYRAALQEWLSQPPKKRGILYHAGRIKDDPYAEEMLRDIYARRKRPETEED